LLTPARERALFLKFNFHKWQFVSARRRLEPQFAKAKDLAVLEGFLRDAVAVKNEIIQANLRLVVSVARKHVRPGASLVELFSEGNIALMRAAEGFDVHKGNRFSTYATLALLKGFARSVPMLISHWGTATSGETLNDVADRRLDHAARHRIDRDEVQQLLSRLNERERRVVLAHYGLENERSAPASFTQLSDRLGIPRQILREIERTAIDKLRAAAADEAQN
jgi:RNA polymerase sigma factor (sigma-70 family)